MRTFYKGIAFSLLAVFGASCEDDDVTTTAQQSVISYNDPMVDLLAGISANSGSNIDVIDSFPCFDIAYPVQVTVNGEQITITTAADLTQVEAVLSAEPYNDDVLQFVYPITVINSEYEQVAVANKAALEALVADCTAGVPDCIGVNYPITFFPINSDTAYTIESDADLFEYIQGFTSGSITVSYPVSFTGYDGQVVTINSNEQLYQSLQQAVADCQANSCATSQLTVFGQAYQSLKTLPDVYQNFTMDALTHEVTFSVTQPGTICSIGYKAEQRPTAIDYLIEIVDENENVLYSGSHQFSMFYKEFVSIPPVAITTGHQYSIRRTVASYAVGLGIGTILWGTAASNMVDFLPYSEGNINLHYARYFNGGGSLDPMYSSMPDLDFVFKTQ